MKQEPYLTVTITLPSLIDGSPIKKEYVITESDINDVEWYGGDSGDDFFDNGFDNDSETVDEERFEVRIEDCLMNAIQYDSDPHTGGEDCDSFGRQVPLPDYTYSLHKFKIEDFYPK